MLRSSNFLQTLIFSNRSSGSVSGIIARRCMRYSISHVRVQCSSEIKSFGQFKIWYAPFKLENIKVWDMNKSLSSAESRCLINSSRSEVRGGTVKPEGDGASCTAALINIIFWSRPRMFCFYLVLRIAIPLKYYPVWCKEIKLFKGTFYKVVWKMRRLHCSFFNMR